MEKETSTNSNEEEDTIEMTDNKKTSAPSVRFASEEALDQNFGGESDHENDIESGDKNGDAKDEVVNNLVKIMDKVGRCAYGVIGMEVWVLSKDRTKLVQPKGGFWVDPVFEYTQPSEGLKRLTDRSRSDFLKAKPIVPGQGLAGVLWADFGSDGLVDTSGGAGNNVPPAHARLARKHLSRSIAGTSGNPMKSMRSMRSNLHINRRGSKSMKHIDSKGHDGVAKRGITWRDVRQLADDPDQPYSPRMMEFPAAGFGIAGGVPFNIRGFSGIVIYLTRATADIGKILSRSNDAFLHSSADLIGSLLFNEDLIATCLAERRDELRVVKRRIRMKVLAMQNTGDDGADGAADGAPEEGGDAPATLQDTLDAEEKKKMAAQCKDVLAVQYAAFKVRFNMWRKKIRGGGAHPTPAMHVNQTIFIFFGSLVQMILLSGVSEISEYQSKGERAFKIGTLAAFTCMQYGLTAAPAAQPGTGFIATLISGFIAQILGYIPYAADWMRESLTAAVVIVAMAKAGCVHPPAAATAIGFCLGNDSWRSLFVVLGSYLWASVIATAIINTSEIRQYPTFWGNHYLSVLHAKLKPCIDSIKPFMPKCCEKKKDDDDME